jgi:SAM-dependent methyltransferase
VPFINRLLPRSVRKAARDVLGLTAVQDQMAVLSKRMNTLEERLYESQSATAERAKTRWRGTAPTTNLTWDRPIVGDAFIAKAAAYHAFGTGRAILEIGPGYGRLLNAILAAQTPFSQYRGLDISPKNVAYLSEQFPAPRLGVIYGDAESAVLPERFDAVISSLVLKHIFPSFEKALTNVSAFLNPGAIVVFDVIEGRKQFFEDDNVTYIRYYAKDELTAIVEHSGLQLVAFDEVLHDADHPRLLVVAKK